MDKGEAAELARSLADLARKSQRGAQCFLVRRAQGDSFQIPDPAVVGDAFAKLSQAILADPARLIQAQMQLWQQMGALWQRQLLSASGEEVAPLIEPDQADRHFKDEAWSDGLIFDYVKQSYLLASRWLQSTVAEIENLDPAIKAKAEFYTRQFVDALSPTNFALTNPTVLKHAAETKGQSPLKGLQHLLDDLERGKGNFKISTTREDAYQAD